MMRHFLGSTALAAVLALTAAPTAAQQLPFTSTIVFGDSLSDTGNLVPLGAFPGAPYVNGRFTSAGGVWADYFATITGDPVIGRAFGGARAVRTTSTDLTAQVTSFLATTPGINRNQLVSIWIGGNDYLALLDPTAPAPTQAQVSTTIASVSTAIATQAGRLRQAGAQNFVLFNLPPLGAIPATSTATAQARNDANQLSSLHTVAVRGVADTLRAGGATVVVVDVETLFRDMAARPSAYGFTNLTVPCFAPTQTAPLAPTGACATAAGLAGTVFYDTIHPTSAAHQVIAQYAHGTLVGSLVSPQGVAVASQLTTGMFDLGVNAVAGRMAGARTGTGNVGINAVQGGTDNRWGVYTFGTWAESDMDALAGQLAYETEAWNAGVGVDLQIDQHLTAGVAVGFGKGDATLADGNGKIDSRTFSGTVYATMATGGLWADAFMGYSYDDLSINRSTGFAVFPVGEGEADAHTYGAGITAGYSFAFGGFGMGPLVGIRYVKTEIDDYTETGAGPLALSFDRMTATSTKGRIGGQASGRFGDDAMAIVPSLELAWEHEFQSDSRAIRGRFANGEVVRTDAAVGKRGQAVLGAALAIEGQGGLMGAISYRGGISGGNGDDHAVSARIRYSF